MATNTKIELKKGGKEVDGTFVANTPKVTAPTAITSDSLKPVTPLNLTQPQPSTAVDGLGGVVQANADAFTANLAEQKKATETTKKSSLDAYIEALKTQQSQTQMEDTAYSQKGGADDLQKELNDINAQINAEVQSNRRQTEAIQKAGGQSKAQVDAQVANINRESIAKQADLSVIQMAKQGQYDSAKAIADRAVRAKFEQQKLYNEALKFNYEENKDLFTTAEAREFSTLLADRERKLNAAEAETKQISDFSIEALKAGAPVSIASQIRSAKTMNEAIALGGAYLRPQPKAITPKAPDLQNFGTATEPNWKQYNTQTGQWEAVSGLELPAKQAVSAQALQSIADVDSLLENKTGMATAVGTTAFSRSSGGGFWSTLGKAATVVGLGPATKQAYSRLTGKEQAFVGGVEQMRQQLTLVNLVRAKQNGATFGALSDGERQMLASSATKIGTWAIKDKNDNVVGYDIDENTFKKEVQTINNFAKIDYINRGGDPQDIGAVSHPDGTVWVKNADGTFTQLK